MAEHSLTPGSRSIVGTCRKDKIQNVMARLDSKIAELKAASVDPAASAEERSKASEALVARQTLLHPTYLQIAHLYADLHE